MSLEQRSLTEPSVIRQSGAVTAEGPEIVPYAVGFTPLYPFQGMEAATGVGLMDQASSYEQTPDTLNLKVVRADTLEIPLFFPGVCWTTAQPTVQEKPDPALPVPWVQHWWNAQVRNTSLFPKDPCWYYNRWIPVFGLPPPDAFDYVEASMLLEFDCASTWVGGVAYGTIVKMRASVAESILLPGTYRWDIQSATTRVLDDETDLYAYGGVRTWLQGDFTVVEDYTIYPTKVST